MGFDVIELVMSIEEHFGIEVPDDASEKLVTVGAIHDFIVAELRRLGREPNSEAVFLELRQLICEQFRLEPGRVVAEARLVDDLRLD